MTLTISTLAAGIEQVNQAYIERPELDGDYPPMIVQYLISALLIDLGGRASDFGFYTDENIGYTGYIAMGDEVLFFAPTKAVVLKRGEPDQDPSTGSGGPSGCDPSGELSPPGDPQGLSLYGVIP